MKDLSPETVDRNRWNGVCLVIVQAQKQGPK
jgi:hypothetical protein